jgi:amino acid adenylation domain-containing protein
MNEAPCSAGEIGLWHHWLAFPDSTAYVLSFAARARGPLDLDRLREAFQQLVDRHAALRSRYRLIGGALVRQVNESTPLDFTIGSCETWRTVRRPMSLDVGPLLRVHVAAQRDGTTTVAIAAHHISVDFWSLRVLMTELGCLYRGETLLAAPDPADFARWQSAWLSSDAATRAAASWGAALAAAPHAASLRPPGPAAVADAHLSLDLTRGLRALARAHAVSPVAALIALWGVVLARHQATDRVVVGVPAAGRRGARLRQLVGYTVNTLPLVIDCAGSLRALLERVGARMTEARRHQHYPLARMVEGAALPFLAVLAYQGARGLQDWTVNAQTASLRLDDRLRLERLDWPPDEVPFETTLTIARVNEKFHARLVYDQKRLDHDEATALLAALRGAVASAVAHPDGLATTLPLIAGGHRSWSAPAPPPIAPTLARAFEQAAGRWPEAIAIAQGAEQITYRALDQLANGVAQGLVAQGVGPEARVGVCLERRPALAAALLGVLKAGAAYVPLDPADPPARCAALCREASVSLVLDTFPTAARCANAPATEGHPDGLSHVLFTSGSTGPPKAVALTHRGAVNLITWGRAFVAPGTRVLAGTPLGFDLSVFELFATLAAGGTVVLTADALATPFDVMLVNTVPSLLAERLRRGHLPPSVRTVNLAGEPLPGALAQRLPRSVTVQNLYGPSETTTYSTMARVAPQENVPSIGGPIDGTRLLVLDEAGQSVPEGFPGELYIGGVGVARGYLERPGETAARFVPDPAGPPGGRAFRTGDRVRWRAGDALFYLGRLDRQLKIRGVRIEPSGVEAELGRAPGVDAVAVRAVGDQLIAWFVGEADPTELRRWCIERLLAHHVPAVFRRVDAMPTTSRGKVDYTALPVSEVTAERTPSLSVTPTERALAALFAEVLDVAQVGDDDDFFVLGGTSLAAARLLERVREALGVDPTLIAFYRTPTVRGLAAELAHAPPARVSPLPVRPPAQRAIVGPATYGQVPLWIATQIAPNSPVYDMSLAIHLEGVLDRDALVTALDAVCATHEGLRTSFRLEEGTLVQRVAPRPEEPPLDYAATGLPDASGPVLDPTRGRVFRATLVPMGRNRHTLLLNMHHLVADAQSLTIVVDDLATAYRAACAGHRPEINPAPLGMVDFAEWERRNHRDATWWRVNLAATLTDASGLLPYNSHPARGANTQRFEGDRVALGLADGQIEALAANWALPCVAVAAGLLASMLGRPDRLTIATPVSLRDHPALDRVVGYLTRVVVVSFNAASADLRGAADRFAAALLDARQHAHEPIEEVFTAAPALMVAEAEGGKSLSGFSGLRATAEPRWTRTAKVDLSLFFGGPGGGYLEYAAARFDRTKIEALATAARRLVADPTANVVASYVTLMEASAATVLGGAPQSDTELVVAAVFAEILEREAVGRNDDFFALGGQSLRAIRVAAGIAERLGVALSVRALFEHPTVAGLAGHVDAQVASLAALLDEIEGLSDGEVRSRLAELDQGRSLAQIRTASQTLKRRARRD